MNQNPPTINPNLIPSRSELNSLCELVRHEKVILWVGSGFSRYAGYPTGPELISIFYQALGITPDPETSLPTLQNVADKYVEEKGRPALIELLKEHYGKAPHQTDAHDSLALIDRVKYIVTTNYDPLFELVYRDKIVTITHDEDLPGSTEYPDKTILLQIHGDLSNPDSVVITSDDYEKFDSDSIVWSKIRSLLAEYSIVFIGYSIGDPNVQEMLRDIYKRLGKRRHQNFFVDNNIDAEKREYLSEFDLHLIEMDAVVAIEYIIANVIRYSLLDALKNQSLMNKSKSIFESRGFHVDQQTSSGKVTQTSIEPNQPDIQGKIKMSISSKNGKGDSPQLIAFQKLITGQSFERVILTDSECNILIDGGEINGVFIFDPSIHCIPSLIISTKPNEIVRADLQLQIAKVRLSNLQMKIYKSAVSAKIEIEDPDINYTLIFNRDSQECTINFSLKHIITDIERANTIYRIFDGWIQGDTLELISDRMSCPFPIPSSVISEKSLRFPLIHEINNFYRDLSDIQRILNVKFQIPEEITREDRSAIIELISFLRGKKIQLSEISAIMVPKIDDPTLFKNVDSFTLEGPGLMGVLDFNIFGRIIQVPYQIEASDIQFKNPEDVSNMVEQGVREFPVILKSKTGQLFAVFQPYKKDGTFSGDES